jgi:hypothetical protein
MPPYIVDELPMIRTASDSGIAPVFAIGTICNSSVLRAIPEREKAPCDGRALAGEEYPALCSVLRQERIFRRSWWEWLLRREPHRETYFPFGGDEERFNVPDLQGRIVPPQSAESER